MGTKIFFPNLDGLRFFAFFLVFWQHATEGLFANLQNDGFLDQTHSRFFVTGGLGVSFFFVLSGFLITYLLLDEAKRNGRVNIKAFYLRRALRIFPLFYLVVIFGFTIYPFAREALGLPGVEVGNVFLYSIFLGNFDIVYSETTGAGFVGVLWSVCIEEQFYLVWAVLFTFLPVRYIKFLLPVIIASSTYFRFINAGNEKILYFHTLSVISDLAVGGSLAYLAHSGSRLIGLISDLDKKIILLVYMAGLFFIWIYPGFAWLDSQAWLQRFIFSLFFAFVIAEQNYAKSSIVKLEKFATISKLGTYTYGLYCLHMIVLYFLDLGFRYLCLDSKSYFSNSLFIVLGLVLCVAVAYLSYVYFESPFLRLKNRFSV